MEQEISKYLDPKKELQKLLILYIDSDELDVENFDNLCQFAKSQNIHENREKLINFLRLLLDISNNHHRKSDFFNKIKKILVFFSSSITSILTNDEIYNTFVSNKLILLYLLEERIITLNEYIVQDIHLRKEKNGIDYFHFFIPEIQNFFKENEINYFEIDFNEFDQILAENYDSLRHIGENETKICSLIRSDSVVEFISYLNVNKISIQSIIERSIFETNSYLNENQDITLIEYASFFGSIQIFQYLFMNNIKVKKNIWLYSIHSNNSELIYHHIIENHIEPEKNSYYTKCFKEAIKCHHNDIADYIQNNLIDASNSNDSNFIKKCAKYSLKYCNYSFYPENIDFNAAFFYLCQYNHLDIVNAFMTNKREEIEKTVSISVNFLNAIF